MTSRLVDTEGRAAGRGAAWGERTRLWAVTVLLLGGLLPGAAAATGKARGRACTTLCKMPPPLPPAQVKYLDPIALRYSPDGRRLYVLCQSGDEVLVLDTASNRLLNRIPVGHQPHNLALSPDGRRLFVSNQASDTVSEIDTASLRVVRSIPVGWGPMGLATGRGGNTLYVADSIGNEVSIVDLKTGREIKRLDAWRSPHGVLLSRDGRSVYVSNLLAHLGPYGQPPVSEITVISTATGAVSRRIPLPGAIQCREGAETPAAWPAWVLIPCVRPKNENPIIHVGQGWTITDALAMVHPRGAAGQAKPEVVQVLLDDIDRYASGPYRVAFTPDGRYALVTSETANEVSVIATGRMLRFLRHLPPQAADRLDSASHFVVRRIAVGRNPTGIAIAPDGRTAFIADRMDDSLTKLNLRTLRVETAVPLAGPETITARRHGEQLFYDASVSYQKQLACASCHPDGGHFDALAWSLQSRVLGRCRVENRTLRGLAGTAPFKWNGQNPNLQTQDGPRAAAFIFRAQGFSGKNLQDLVAFVGSIPLPRNRHLAADGHLTAAQNQGRLLFNNLGCAGCHDPTTHYTRRFNVDVGTMTSYDSDQCFPGHSMDVPQLERVTDNAPYLHNGEAQTLEEIWTKYNPTERHGVVFGMSKLQLDDLVEYLKTF